MKNEFPYFRYEITNGTFTGIGGADYIAECREVIQKYKEEDQKTGGYDDYHVFRLNKRTGERLTKVF